MLNIVSYLFSILHNLIERAIANTSLYVLYRIADVFEVEIKEQLI
jgi:hypothetical protein